MSRIYADFLPLESSDAAKNYGLLPPVVKVLLSIPNDIEFLVSRSDKEEVTEIRKALQIVLNGYVRKARELVRHYRTDRGAGNINFVARNTRLGPGTNLTYVSNYGVEYITLRISGDEAREIIKKVKEEEEDLCLMVMYDNNKVLGISMRSITSGNFRVLYRATLKSDWSSATSRTAGGFTTFGEWQPLNMLQLKLDKSSHIGSISGIQFSDGRVEDIELDAYIFNTSTGLFGGIRLSSADVGTAAGHQFNGSGSTIYTPEAQLAVGGDGSLTVVDSRAIRTGGLYYSSAILVDSDGGRYIGEAGFGKVWWISPPTFTAGQDAAYTAEAASNTIIATLCGPGDGDIAFVSGPTPGTVAGSIQFPVWTFSQANGLDQAPIQFETISQTRVESSPLDPGDYDEWSGFGESYTNTFSDPESGTTNITPYSIACPSLGKTLNKMFASVTRTTNRQVAYTPYEQVTFTSSFPALPLATLHASNGKHYIQGYRVYGGLAWRTDQKFYLDSKNITGALEGATGASSNRINAMFMDIKLSDIKKLK